MIKVIVTSLNPAKIKAVEAAFLDVFPSLAMQFEGIAVNSRVSDQPMSSEETLQGAQNRIQHAKSLIQAEFYVSIEAGIDDGLTFAWMLVESKQQVGRARSASLPLPPAVLQQLAQGKELGDVMDALFATQNIKQQGGAIGLLTQHLLTRSSVYHQALILALIPFINQELFPAKA